MTLDRTKQKLEADATGNSAMEIFLNHIECEAENDEEDRSWGELFGWAYPPPRKLSYQQATEKALKSTTLEECHAILKQAGKQPKGRIPIKQVPAIKALIYRKYVKWPWPKITSHFCPCCKATHNPSCQNSHRAEVGHLQRLLKKYRTPIP